MSIIKFSSHLLFSFALLIPGPAIAQPRENIVLLPIEVSPEYANQKNLIGGALQQALSRKFNVFFGDSVEEALEAEYAKEDCSAETCVQNIAILFNGEIVVDASVQLVEESTFLRLQFQNVITGELEGIVQEACNNCSFTQLVRFIDNQAGAVQLNSSPGLTALLEKEAQPQPLQIPPVRAETPKQATVLPPQADVERPKKAKSSSFWKWGLGALVLGAAGGGGGGGGDGGGNSLPPTTANITPFDTPGMEYADNPNLLSGGYTYINYPNSNRHKFYRNAFNYGRDGNLPDVETTNGSHSQTYSSAGELFRFQVNSGAISRMTIIDGGDSNVSQFNFDVLDGGTITQSLGPSNVSHLSYFTNDEAQQFLGLALTQDYQSNVGGIARIFFGVAQQTHWDYDREIIAFHGGQPADDGVVPSSGDYEFEGYSAGHWVNPNDFNYWTTSDIEVEVDFTAGQAQLISSNTLKSTNPRGANSWSNEPGLDFSVEGAFRLNPSRIEATTTNAAGDVLPTLGPDGAADGGAWKAYFYEAPSASETSGTFTFYSKNGNREAAYVGAFGARR